MAWKKLMSGQKDQYCITAGTQMTSQDKGEGEGRALDSWDVNDTLDWSMAVCY